MCRAAATPCPAYDPCGLSLIYLPLLLKFYRQVEDTKGHQRLTRLRADDTGGASQRLLLFPLRWRPGRQSLEGVQ
jgi:hypothetical protein